MSEAYTEEYRVKYLRDKSTNRIIQELWYDLEGKLARNDDLPTRIFYDSQGRPVEMSWGQRHRENGPCELRFNPDNGVVTFEMWCHQGEVHRADGEPAVIHRDKNSGAVTQIEHYDMGKHLGGERFRRDSKVAPKL